MVWLFGSLEADFLRTFGIDLVPYAAGASYMSVRRFQNLILALPDDSAYVRAIQSDQFKHRIYN
jgi:hypothetical protein